MFLAICLVTRVSAQYARMITRSVMSWAIIDVLFPAMMLFFLVVGFRPPPTFWYIPGQNPWSASRSPIRAKSSVNCMCVSAVVGGGITPSGVCSRGASLSGSLLRF